MVIKKELYVWICVLTIFLVLLFVMFRGGITGNPVYKIYNIENFPGIYVDFGPSQSEGSTKWGPAAVGNFGELWNAPFINGSQYTFFPLKYSNGELSDMKIQLSNFDSSSSVKTNLGDEMFDTYVYSNNINKIPSIMIYNMIEGSYDIYIYGNMQESNANYELYKYNYESSQIKSTFYGLRSSYTNSDVLVENNWQEGIHYVTYKDVEFEKGDSLELYVRSYDKNGEIAKPFISGMQIVKAGTKLAYNESIESKIVECYDSDGGINFTITGKLYLNGKYSAEDICDNQNSYINELYCENGIKSIELHKCDFGCVDGICITNVKFAECDGCLYNQICISKGTRIDNKYCELDKFLKLQKGEGAECRSDFECETNSCNNGICESLESVARRELGVKYNIVKLICRINNFNDERYNTCLYEAFSPLIDENKESEIKVEDVGEINKTQNNYSANPLPEPSL